MWFILHKKILLGISATVMLVSLTLIAIIGLPLGIDFTGGALTEVAYNDTAPAAAEVSAALEPLGLGDFSVRATTDELGRDGYIIRTTDLAESERQTVQDAIVAENGNAEVVRYTSIGPVIGEELKDKAIWAIVAISLIIITYIGFAFSGVSYPVGSWVYGGITIVALLHDVLVPTAVMVVLGVTLGVEADVLFVMALLAVLGYSVNDTIVVFDRVRENLQKYRQEKKVTVKDSDGFEREEISYILQKPFAEIVGLSVQQTLLRSINTSVTTLLALSALLIFGGEITRTFTIVLMAGVVAGTYSSICLANPLLVYISERAVKTETSPSS